MGSNINLLPTVISLVVGQDNDKVISAGPFTLGEGGPIISRTGKRLRFLIKSSATTPDASAILDLNSVDNTGQVYGVSTADTGLWAIDIRDRLPAAGDYWCRIDLTNASSLTVDREVAALIQLTVQAV